MIKMTEKDPSTTTKTKCWPVSDRTVLLRPIPGLLVLVQALGQTHQLDVITFPGEAGFTVFFVCCTAVKHRKAALHLPTTACQRESGNEGLERRGQGVRSSIPIPRLFVAVGAGEEDLSVQARRFDTRNRR